MPENIDDQAEQFAQRITELARAFGGPTVVPFRSDVISGGAKDEGDSWRIEVSNEAHIPMFADGFPAFRITASWSCSAGGDGHWLRVDKSRFHVFMESNERKPMFRYEYDNGVNRDLPQAHIHFHSDHSEMNHSPALQETEDALGQGGNGSRRARRRRRNNLSDMHFPWEAPDFVLLSKI